MKKIMFSTEYGFQQGVIARTKTMTRRVDKKLNHPLVTDISEWGIDDKGKCYLTITYSTGLTEDVYPAYQIGEEIAIAQPYKVTAQQNREWLDLQLAANVQYIGELMYSGGWENKMFVSAYYCPNRIRIKNIKAERLQDISDEDCIREGITTITEGKNEVGNAYGWDVKIDALERDSFFTPRAAFAALIDKVSGKGTWERNPWVFVYEFELVNQQRVRIELKQTKYGTDNKE